MPDALDRRLSVAPMLDWSDRHYRYFVRQLAPRALLYTEMVVAQALLRGDPARLLRHDAAEYPLALQLGGSDPAQLAAAARIGADVGHAEINLNVGCPSERVQNATFGACLMADPQRVADCVAAMAAAVTVPVTVKCRIGIDDQDSYEFLRQFVDTVAATGCRQFVVHARKAILSGLTPKQNRDIPPLRYEVVHRLKAERPDLTIVLNGGLRTLESVAAQRPLVDGVMIGREAYHHPYFMAALESALWPDVAPPPSPPQLIAQLRPYIETELSRGTRLHSMTRHLLGIYAYRSGARAFRRVMSQLSNRPGAGFTVLEAAVRAAEAQGNEASEPGVGGSDNG